jgi:hypothetical protein
MGDLTEAEIVSRHKQALGEAHSACQELGRNADPLYLAPRGKHYIALRQAIEHLEGSARQMAHFRGDARWTKLGFLYARLLQSIQPLYVRTRWAEFGKMAAFFGPDGQRRLDELQTRKTGKSGLILPDPGRMDWLILPDAKPAIPRAQGGRTGLIQ